MQYQRAGDKGYLKAGQSEHKLSWGFLILLFPFLFTLLSTFAIFFIRKMKFNQF